MHYSFALMPQYADRRDLDEIERKPYWCVVKVHESEDEDFGEFFEGVEHLTGVGIEFLTQSEARRKADELEDEDFRTAAFVETN